MTRPFSHHNGSGRRTTAVNDPPFIVLSIASGFQRRLDVTALVRHGLRVVGARTIEELRRVMDRACPDLVVVDAAIVGDSWADVLARARAVSTPLVAVDVPDPAARVALLLAGVDDCLPAPYTSQELAARVVAIGRRVNRIEPLETSGVIRVGSLQLDVRARRVRLHGAEITLTAIETDLLGCFLRHPDEVLSREWLLTEVWGYTSGTTETVTVHVRRLRSKVESDPSRPELIQTIWGIGYRLGVDDHQLAAVDGPLPALPGAA